MGPRRIGCDGGWHLVGGECVPAGRRETCTSVGIGGAHLLALPLLNHGLIVPLDGILAILSHADIFLIVELLHKILRSFQILGGLPCVLLLGEALPSDEVLLPASSSGSSMEELHLPFVADRIVHVCFPRASDTRHVLQRSAGEVAYQRKDVKGRMLSVFIDCEVLVVVVVPMVLFGSNADRNKLSVSCLSAHDLA